MFNHCLIHGVKIQGRRPRLEDFMTAKKKTIRNGAALLKAQAQIAAVRAKALEEKQKKTNG